MSEFPPDRSDSQEDVDITSAVVTIGMPVFNGERFIREALDSILSQTYREFELIISDNHSTDDTPAIVRQYAARDSRIRYFRQPQNLGLFRNTEFVMQAGAGRYFMLVGDDDVYEPTYLERLVGILERSAEVGLAYSNFGYVSENGDLVPGGTPVLRRSSCSRFSNLLLYVIKRPCLPMMMGVFRMNVIRRALPFVPLKKMTGDVDNVFMVRVLALTNIEGVDQVLFRYRLKDRASSLPSDWPAGSLAQARYLFMHNALVSAKMCHAISRSDLPLSCKGVLLVHTYLVLLANCVALPVARRFGLFSPPDLQVGRDRLEDGRRTS